MLPITYKPIFVLLIILILIISCSEDKKSPVGSENNAPVIQSISADPTSIKINETTTLTCNATDEDNDNITYAWSSANGTFPNGTSSSSITWRAPAKAGSQPVEITVSDGDKSDNGVVNISVEQGGGTVGGEPCPGVPTISYAGKTYNTVQIGDQCWLKENLNLGTMNVDNENQTDDSIIEKYCYNNDEANCDKYGGLYEWNEAMQYVTTEGAQGICPDGWHIPTQQEYNILIDAVDSSGNALKAVGQGTYDGAGTNTSGFSALLSGYRKSGGGFTPFLGSRNLHLSSSESASFFVSISMNDNTDKVDLNGQLKSNGGSIRCIKD